MGGLLQVLGQLQEVWVALLCLLQQDKWGERGGGHTLAPGVPERGVGPAQVHLQHMVQQGHAALLRLGLRELQKRADLEAVGVPRVAALPGSGCGVRAPEARWEGEGMGGRGRGPLT